MLASELQIGQSITASFFFRCGYCGGDVDHAVAVGSIIKKMECYNQVLIQTNRNESFNCPNDPIWVSCDKAEISINN